MRTLPSRRRIRFDVHPEPIRQYLSDLHQPTRLFVEQLIAEREADRPDDIRQGEEEPQGRRHQRFDMLIPFIVSGQHPVANAREAVEGRQHETTGAKETDDHRIECVFDDVFHCRHPREGQAAQHRKGGR